MAGATPVTTFGARALGGGVQFTLWAPVAHAVELELIRAGGSDRRMPLEPHGEGLWRASTGEAAAGDRYRLRADGGPFWPDPASRFQPEGVHGPSEIVDPASFPWTDQGWSGLSADELVIYELHVGTFSTPGTFAGVEARLPYLRDLGVTAIELMPVAEFPGRWNWGYDGAALYAPSHRYGRPDDLRRLVDRAHALGLVVLLDVVYNHLGPDGAYLAAFAPAVLRHDQDSPWGGGLDFEPTTGARFREFCIDNACHWIAEYHLDGLRLDATHAIVERTQPTLLAELASAARRAASGRRVRIIAEDDRNLADIVRPVAQRGFGLDGVWADDFHHQVHCHLTGEHDGYFQDFTGTTEDIATTVRDGWFYQGTFAPHFGRTRGTATAGIPRHRFVVCLQNHDQVGNRALGERLHHLANLDAFAAASVLCLLAPETPLIFMGQEWATTAPFQYFTDHAEPLGSAVVSGRRQEFRSFEAFRDPDAAEKIPSPQAPETFQRSRLPWDERGQEPHRRVEDLYRRVLAVRRAMRAGGVGLLSVAAADDGALVLEYGATPGPPSDVVCVRLSGSGPVRASVPVPGWSVALATDTILHGREAVVDAGGDHDMVTVGFDGPAAVVLTRTEGRSG